MASNVVQEMRPNTEWDRVAVATQSSECSRCGGLLVASRYIDLLDDTGQIEFDAERCVQCGEVLDPVIRRNRLCQIAAEQQRNDSKEVRQVA